MIPCDKRPLVKTSILLILFMLIFSACEEETSPSDHYSESGCGFFNDGELPPSFGIEELGMEFVRIPAGTFTMGSEQNDLFEPFFLPMMKPRTR